MSMYNRRRGSVLARSDRPEARIEWLRLPLGRAGAGCSDMRPVSATQHGQPPLRVAVVQALHQDCLRGTGAVSS
jgi:hypothetical protein